MHILGSAGKMQGIEGFWICGILITAVCLCQFLVTAVLSESRSQQVVVDWIHDRMDIPTIRDGLS